ncbi:MAG: hypothetical protein K8R25_02880 [Methanosarcinales archaeon]|nr:hypothetical protein [Methanosarcinales archaeon]
MDGKFLIYFFASIIAPLVYIKLEHGFATSITNKLTNPNFDINFTKTLNLTIGYGTGSLLFIYIFKEFIEYSSIPLENTNVYTNTMPFLAFSFCYLARIITRQRGHSFGQLYITVVVILASVIFLINIMITSNVFNIDLFTIIPKISSQAYIIFMELLLFVKNMIPTLLTGSIFMAFPGEITILKIVKPNVRSIPTVLEKFPSDFLVITGNNEIENKMVEMTKQQNVFSIKCITNTYRAFDNIQSNLKQQIDNFNKNNDEQPINNNKFDFRIIGPSEEDVLLYIKKTHQSNIGKYRKSVVNRILPHYSNFLEYESKTEVNNRILKLKTMIKNGEIKHKEKNFGAFRMLVVNDNEILFTVASKDNDKIGLYTKEKYVIQLCINIFDVGWE